MNSEIIRYRMLLLNGILGVPAWGFILQRLEPGLFDPMWFRFTFSAFLLICLTSSYQVEKKQKFLEAVLVFGGWILMAHTAWLAYVTRLPYSVFCGYLIVLSGLLNVFPTKRSTWLLGGFGAISGIIVATVPNEWIASPLFVNFSLWTTVIVSLSANFTRIQHLHALSSIQDRMAILFQNMKEGLLVFDPDGKVVISNPAACQIFGLPPNSLQNSQILDAEFLTENGKVLPTDKLPFVAARTQNLEVRDVIAGIRRPDGSTAWTKMTAAPFLASPDAQQNSVLMTFSDISEVKKSHRIIFEQQARLEATAKLTALGEMAAGVAHEINNPLAIILGKVYIIEKFLQTQKTGEPIEVSLSKIAQTVERIKRIVKGLQTFAMGGEQDPFQSTNLANLVNETISLCQEKLSEKNIQIQLDLETNLNFDCRPIQISQSLVNLVYNACDAIEHLDDRWIRIWARSAHQTLVLTITDSGHGIPEEVQKRLMQPFFTTKGPGRGTGLGLSITRGLINSHLGRIWLDSSATHTTFIIELPLQQKPQKNAS